MGKEVIIQTFKHQKADSIPWVPFAGVHAGKLKGYAADEMLQDADKIVDALKEVHKVYMPDGIPVLFDLQIEAEILGCELMWAKNNPPSVKTHPLEADKTIPCTCKFPTPDSGRMPIALEATRRIKEEIGDDTAIYGLICGPFTLASHLRGSGLFMDMMKDPDYVVDLVEYCGQVACRMADMYIEAGADIIAVVDPLMSQVSPKMIDKLLAGSFKAVFDFIRSKGVYSSFFVCGNATKQVESLCKTNPDGISVDENVNLAEAKKITDEYNIVIGGNIPLTTTMLYGSQQDNIKSVVDLIDSVDNLKNFIVSPGCDMPYDIPLENTIACAQATKNPDSSREMIRNYEGGAMDDIDIEIPDYANSDKVIIELFLLDPEQCAACTYMLASVEDAYDDFKDIAEYRVYKYTVREDIARTMKMGIKNLPTMCINGEQKFISLIPSREELLNSIREYAK